MRNPRFARRATRKRGISDIIATVLMVLLVASIGTAIFAYTSGGLGSYGSNFGNMIANQGVAVSQQMNIEEATFNLVSGLPPYVRITLNNTQSSPTPSTFQQIVSIDPSSYTSYEASDLGNIRFFSKLSGGSFSNPINAWLESVNGNPANAATNASFWVKLTTAIPATSSTTIYLVFEQPTSTEFDGTVAGEAPEMSPVYGQYDNGANVFSLYFNGNTALGNFNIISTSGYTLSQTTTSFGASTINALKLSSNGGSSQAEDPMVYSASSVSASNSYVEESVFQVSTTGVDMGWLGLGSSTNPSDYGTTGNGVSGAYVIGGWSSSNDNIAYENGGVVSSAQGSGSLSANTWYYGEMNYVSGSGTFATYFGSSLYTQTNGLTANNPVPTSSSLYIAPIWKHTGTAKGSVIYDWMRVRAYPPNNTMPTVSVGSFNAGSQAGANIYVRNTGTVPVTIDTVYVENITSYTLVLAYSLSPSVTIQPGSFVEIPIFFLPIASATYQFKVVTTLGSAEVANFPA